MASSYTHGIFGGTLGDCSHCPRNSKHVNYFRIPSTSKLVRNSKIEMVCGCNKGECDCWYYDRDVCTCHKDILDYKSLESESDQKIWNWILYQLDHLPRDGTGNITSLSTLYDLNPEDFVRIVIRRFWQIPSHIYDIPLYEPNPKGCTAYKTTFYSRLLSLTLFQNSGGNTRMNIYQ